MTYNPTLTCSYIICMIAERLKSHSELSQQRCDIIHEGHVPPTPRGVYIIIFMYATFNLLSMGFACNKQWKFTPARFFCKRQQFLSTSSIIMHFQIAHARAEISKLARLSHVIQRQNTVTALMLCTPPKMSLTPLVLCSLTLLLLPGSGWAATPCTILKGDSCKCTFKDTDGSNGTIDLSHYFSSYP